MYKRNFSIINKNDLDNCYLTRLSISDTQNVADSIYYNSSLKEFEIKNVNTSGYLRLPLGKMAVGDTITIKLSYKYISGNNGLIIAVNGSNRYPLYGDTNFQDVDTELDKKDSFTNITLNYVCPGDFKYTSLIIGTTGTGNVDTKKTYSIFKNVDIEINSIYEERFTRKASIKYNDGEISKASSSQGNYGISDNFTCVKNDDNSFKITFDDYVPVKCYPVMCITQESYWTKKRMRGMVKSIKDSDGSIKFEFYVEFVNADDSTCKIADVGSSQFTFSIILNYR